jgi:hypothetical protein
MQWGQHTDISQSPDCLYDYIWILAEISLICNQLRGTQIDYFHFKHVKAWKSLKRSYKIVFSIDTFKCLHYGNFVCWLYIRSKVSVNHFLRLSFGGVISGHNFMDVVFRFVSTYLYIILILIVLYNIGIFDIGTIMFNQYDFYQ